MVPLPINKIDRAELTVTAPVRGGTPVNEASMDSAENRFSVAKAQWMAPDGTALDPSDRFAPGTEYTMVITLEAKRGYSFQLDGLLGVGDTDFFINGCKARVISGSAEQVSICYTFTAICDVLNCQPGDILEYSPEDKEQLSINSQPGAAPRGTAPG